MATTNYGLPQFNGEFATQPIQFRTTITDGFNKIDEVMKQNEEAAAPVAEMQTEIEGIQTQINNLKVVPAIEVTNLQMNAVNHFLNLEFTSPDFAFFFVEVNYNPGTGFSEGDRIAKISGNPFSLTRETSVYALSISRDAVNNIVNDVGYITLNLNVIDGDTYLYFSYSFTPEANYHTKILGYITIPFIHN